MKSVRKDAKADVAARGRGAHVHAIETGQALANGAAKRRAVDFEHRIPAGLSVARTRIRLRREPGAVLAILRRK